ncbi:hypothetical protein RCL1_002915 [Eukaryota sp. TZLM3-RCL]
MKLVILPLLLLVSAVICVTPDIYHSYRGTVMAEIPGYGLQKLYPVSFDYLRQRKSYGFSVGRTLHMYYEFYNEKVAYHTTNTPDHNCYQMSLSKPMYSHSLPISAFRNHSYVEKDKEIDVYVEYLQDGSFLSWYVRTFQHPHEDVPRSNVEKFLHSSDRYSRFTFDHSYNNIYYNDQYSFRPGSCPALPKLTSFSLSGFVYDATSKNAIVGAVVYLTGTGQSREAIVGKDGSYTFDNLPKGTFLVSATHSNFTLTERWVTITDFSIPVGTLADLPLSPVLEANNYRFVLLWGEVPSELELRVTFPNNCQVRPSNIVCTQDEVIGTNDVSTAYSFGPDVVTLKNVHRKGRFTISVLAKTKEIPLAGSKAVVHVFGHSGLLITVVVSEYGEGTTWSVGYLEDGTFVTENVLV